MSIILFSDPHWNDKPGDAYRWDLLPWLKEQAAEYKAEAVICGGDMCDAKDRHSAVVVNRLADQLRDLGREADVYINMGNHDYLSRDWPFFEFVDMLPNVRFVAEPQSYKIDGSEWLFLPATNDWENDWKGFDFSQYDYLMAHATFEGCLSENGTRLSGIPTSIFAGTKAKIYSGDIHVPQKAGPVEYVGAPYRTRFGDAYDPRCIIVDNASRARDVHFPCPSKHVLTVRTITDLEKELRQCKRGDAVKVRVRLLRSEQPEWNAMKKEIRDLVQRRGMELVGPENILLDVAKREDEPEEFKRIDPSSLVRRYGRRERVSKASMEIGLEVLQEVT